MHNIGFMDGYGPQDPQQLNEDAPSFSMTNRPPCYNFYDSIQGSRKCVTLDEVHAEFDVNDASEEERHCLYVLPIKRFTREDANDLFEATPPRGYQFFIGFYRDQYYFVDTQGFSYSRYVTRLSNFEQPDLGI